VWYDQVPQIRALFEKHAHGDGAEAFLSKVEHDLRTYAHPDPYTFPYYEGGTKWQRNLPPPAFVADEHSAIDWWR
jgi:NADH dehydrogenase (ubiquinone) 1 beta subcomplex subunit 9